MALNYSIYGAGTAMSRIILMVMELQRWIRCLNSGTDVVQHKKIIKNGIHPKQTFSP
jgi:hypothetical protein